MCLEWVWEVFFPKAYVRNVCVSVCVLVCFQQPQQSNICSRSFQTRSFWRSSPTYWNRTSVRQHVSARGSASLPTTPSYGQCCRGDRNGSLPALNIKKQTTYILCMWYFYPVGSVCTWRCLSTRVPWCTLSPAGSTRSAPKSTNTQTRGRRASSSWWVFAVVVVEFFEMWCLLMKKVLSEVLQYLCIAPVYLIPSLCRLCIY